MPLKPYTKTWKSYAELVEILIQRNLIVSDRTKAEAFLSHVNYYRFSSYCFAFDQPGQRHSFVDGTTFEQIEAGYHFDLKLRGLLREALEVIEIDLRTTITHHLGERYGAFGHLQSHNFHHTFRHSEWIQRLRDEVNRSKDSFVNHFRTTYLETTAGDLPVWVSAELMTFGSMSLLLRGLLVADLRQIAKRYHRQGDQLVNWIHHLSTVRNTCAHLSRIWDRIWDVKPRILPNDVYWNPPHLLNNKGIAATLLVIYQLLQKIPTVSDWSALWQVRLRKVLSECPQSPVTRKLGLTDQWFANAVWSSS